MSSHPLDDFLSAWESSCGRHAVDLRLRVHRVIERERSWDRARLRDTLRSLLAFDEVEQRAFDECFDDYFSDAELPPWLAKALAEAPPDPTLAIAQLAEFVSSERSALPPKPTNATRPASPPRTPLPPVPTATSRTPLVLAALGLGVLVVFSLLRPPPPPRPPADAGVSDARIEATADAGAGEPPTSPLPTTTTQPTARAERLATLSVTRSEETAPRYVLPSLAVLALALVVDTWMRWRATRPVKLKPIEQTIEEPKVDTLKDRQLDLSWPDPLAPIFTRDECERLAMRTGFSRDEQRVALHLVETVQATARAGGLLEPVYRPVRRPSVLRVVTPEALAPFATCFVEAFVRGMTAAGVVVERGHGGPEHGRNDLNLVFIDARHSHSDATLRWVRGGHVALVELRDQALWDVEVQRLPCGVFPPTFEGLCEALDAARANLTPPRRDDDELLTGDAFDRLGNAHRLAVALAATGPLDLPGLDALRRRFTPWLPFMAMQRVTGLDVILGDETGWWCDDALRARLLRGVTRDSELWQAACDWQSARFERIRPPEGSRAKHEHRVALLLNRLRRDGTLTRDEWEELRVLQAQPSMRRIVGHLIASLVRTEDGLHPKGREESAILEELGLIPPRNREEVPRSVLVRWAVASALSAIVAVLGVYSVVRYRPVTFAIWGGLQTPIAGVARGEPSEVGCEATRWLVGVGSDGRARCARISYERSATGVVPVVAGPTESQGERLAALRVGQCPNGAVVTGVSGTRRANDVVSEIALECARPSREGVGFAKGARAAEIYGQSSNGPQFTLTCGPHGSVGTMHVYVDADVVRGISLDCVALTH